VFYQPNATNTGTMPWNYSYVMYYDGTNGNNEDTGLAYSTDGLDWSAYTGNPVLNNASAGAWDCVSAIYGTVYKDAAGFHYFYSGKGQDNGSGGCVAPASGNFNGIGYASSTDGETWVKDTNPIFATSDGVPYRTGRIYTPSVINDGSGILRMYFSAQDSAGGAKKIGYATLTTPTAALHVIKLVVNRNGSTAVPANFMVHVKSGGSEVAGSPLAGAGSPGTSYSLVTGTYIVSEDASSSYTESIAGDCAANGNITLAAGDNKTCTITNTNNTVPPLATLHVIKLVVNGNGNTAVASDFALHVEEAGTDVRGSPAAGTSTPGTLYSLSPGTYTVGEATNTFYIESFTGDCDASGAVTLSAGDDKICTVVNTDIPPPAPLVIPVAPAGGGGGGGGGGGSGRIIPLIGILKVPTPLALPAGPGPVTYNYTVWNVGGQQALDDITVTDDKCSPVTLLSGDTNGNGKLDPGEKWKYSCTAALATTTTNTAIVTGYSDDSYHQPAVATAIATVVVAGAAAIPGFPNTGVVPTTTIPGFPSTGIMPPLINVVEVPSRLTPFPFGGGSVTYTYTVTNPGVVAMNNIVVTDDKCAPISGPSGDINGNGLLDPGETWTYTCQTNVPVSAVNIAAVKGSANGFTAIGYSFATVLVFAPELPNTGSVPVLSQQIRTINTNLYKGSSNSNVATLQQFLISQNGGPASQALANVGATSYFGALTRAALAEFQANAEIAPALGNLGPITRAYLTAYY
jgi:hypothetical protein